MTTYTTVEKTSAIPSDVLRARVQALGKPWTKKMGETRYYVDSWEQMIDLEVDHYNTGNVCSVYLGEEKMSNRHYMMYVRMTKVWLSEDGTEIHVDRCDDEDVEKLIVRAVRDILYAEVE